MNQKDRPGIGYCGLKTYLKFLHDKVYYKNTFVMDKENIPEDGTSLLVVSNHQNCLNDALGILFALDDRKSRFITRGDAFTIHPLLTRLFNWVGLLPSYRLEHEGEENLSKNNEIFSITEQALIDGQTIVMFPEAGHQDRHWLGSFTYGYTRLAFEAAEKTGFEKDILILPSCNHYSDYFGLRNDLIIRFGTPISLRPYYELYKTKPRTAQREVNRLVRSQIDSMMLDIKDIDNYDAIDFIRNTYGIEYARKIGKDPTLLPDKLETDKTLVSILEKAASDASAELKSAYGIAKRLDTNLKDEGICFRQLSCPPKVMATVLKTMGMILLLPLGIFSCWPSLPAYYISRLISSRTKDRMWEGTFLFAISAMVTLPVSAAASLLTVGFLWNWPTAILYILSFPLLIVFCWNYFKWLVDLISDIRFIATKRKSFRTSVLRTCEGALFGKLRHIIKTYS